MRCAKLEAWGGSQCVCVCLRSCMCMERESNFLNLFLRLSEISWSCDSTFIDKSMPDVMVRSACVTSPGGQRSSR